MWNATGPDSNRNAPPGVVPDYKDPEDVYWTLNIVLTTICVFFITLFFIVRIFVKRTISRNFGLEDWTCIAAFITAIMYCVTAFMSTSIPFSLRH